MNSIVNSLRKQYYRKKFWIIDILKGGKMWKPYMEVKYILKHNLDGKADLIIEKRLTKFLQFATTNASFYKKYADKVTINDLSSYPVVNKSIIINHQNEFYVPKDIIPGQLGDVHVQKTSGSTGTPFEIRQDTRCRMRRIATIKVCNETFGFHSFERLMHLRAIRHYWNFPDDLTWNKQLQILYADNSNLTDEKIRAIVQAINDYDIRFVRGYMTSEDAITQYVERHHLEFKNQLTFISSGEHLLESLRQRILRLGCNVINQYANEENGVLGQSDLNAFGDEIVLNRANCIVEILKFNSDEPVGENEIGRIVVTDFTDYAMPMIRYEIGDVGAIGRKSPSGAILSIKNLVGRKTDIIYKTDGSPIDLFNSISPEIYNNPEIRQWQFIQRDEKKYILNLCVFDIANSIDKKRAEQLMKDCLGMDADVEINITFDVPVMLSGKRKIVVQEYHKLRDN